MLRRNREISIFNMSALDLFASALGAFLLLTLILMPYYLKTDRSMLTALQQRQQEKEQLEQQNDALQKKAEILEKKAGELQSELDKAVQFALLGITTTSAAFVLVIDMSRSMEKYTQIMIDTVERLLAPMDDGNLLQLIGYQGTDGVSIHSWQNPYQLAPMDGANKPSAASFARGLTAQFDGGTPTGKALIEALQYPAEAIILLTDGAPDSEPDAIIRDVTQQNGGAKEIHCVALGNYRAAPGLVTFLEELAKANRGGFVGVSN